MSNIPSLDLNDFLSNDKTRKDAFVKSVGKAYQEIGFLSLICNCNISAAFLLL